RDIQQYGATWQFKKYSGPTDYSGTVLFSITLAPGACIDKGSGCKFRDSAATSAHTGLEYVRVQYKTGKTWMRAYGDLSGADTSYLGFEITINSPTHPIFGHAQYFVKKPWGWFLSDKCWDGCA
ncbi:MAG TPA: hypothetical protein VFR41_08165, partial [Acidimicrobiia bacterium]|nr:hypothetical protein [Acidimicrobiia bacterium]